MPSAPTAGYAALVGLEFDDEDETACRVLEVQASGAVPQALYYVVADHPDRACVTAADCEAAAAAHVAQMLPCVAHGSVAHVAAVSTHSACARTRATTSPSQGEPACFT